MNTNLIFQYVAVGVVLAGAVAWIIRRLFRMWHRPSSCGDCTLCTVAKARRRQPPCSGS